MEKTRTKSTRTNIENAQVARAVLERYGGLDTLVHISIEVTIDREQRRS